MHRILNRDLIWICILAVPICLADPRGFLTEYLPGAFAVSIPMALLLFFIPGSFGGGDIKFTAAAGLVLESERYFWGVWQRCCLPEYIVSIFWYGKRKGERQFLPLVPSSVWE